MTSFIVGNTVSSDVGSGGDDIFPSSSSSLLSSLTTPTVSSSGGCSIGTGCSCGGCCDGDSSVGESIEPSSTVRCIS